MCRVYALSCLVLRWRRQCSEHQGPCVCRAAFSGNNAAVVAVVVAVVVAAVVVVAIVDIEYEGGG